MRHNTIIYKYLRQYITILVTNATLFCAWRAQNKVALVTRIAVY